MSLLLGAMFVTLYPENVVDGEQVWISPFDVHVTRPGFSGLNIHVQLVVLTIQALVGGLLGTSIGLAMDLRCMLQRLGNCHSEEAISLASRNN
jgi:predicted membrane-bound spermidine synthase